MISRLIYLLLIVFTFSLPSSAQEITMFPGFFGVDYYQDTEEISSKEVNKLMLRDKEANQYWQKSNSHMILALVAVGAEVGFLIWQLSSAGNGKSQTVPLIGVVGSGIVAIGFSFSSANLKKKAILKYNENLDVGTTLNLGATYNGLGLVYQF